MRYWLSLDFDYFIREKLEWDWGHRESEFFRDVIWPMRASGIIFNGYTLEDATGIDKHAAPRPMEFWETLKSLGVNALRPRRIVVSDSHMFAYQTFSRGKADAILHFDAHHDLGYEGFERLWNDGKVDCGSWLYPVLRNHPSMRCHVVFPAWKGTVDWEDADKRWWIKEVMPRIDMSVWPKVKLPKGQIDTIHICRSGSWVPSWHDADWLRFIEHTEKVLKRKVEQPYRKQEGADVLEARDFSMDEVMEQAKSLQLFKQAKAEGVFDEALKAKKG